MRVLFFVSLVFLYLFSFISAQAPIPHRPSGVVYPGTSTSAAAPIVFEIFIDPLCPDCKATWPVVKQIASHYGTNIRLLTHIFPLPYHTWSFMASQGFQTIASVTGGNNTALYQYIDLIFNNQYLFDNDITASSSSKNLIDLFSQTVEKAGLISASTMATGLSDSTNNWNTRVEWKYGCSRSILGTPSFLINGVFVGASSSWQLSDWQTVLDPLLPATQRKSAAASTIHKENDADEDENDTECPAGRTLCTYLPGKTECCLAGEYCIPNVGCRC